jgi:hypothetical protein
MPTENSEQMTKVSTRNVSVMRWRSENLFMVAYEADANAVHGHQHGFGKGFVD